METTTTTSNGNKLTQIWESYKGPEEKLAEHIYKSYKIRLTDSGKKDLCDDMLTVLKSTVAYRMTDPRDWYQKATHFDRRKATAQRIIRMTLGTAKGSARPYYQLARDLADLCDFDLLPLMHGIREDIEGVI